MTRPCRSRRTEALLLALLLGAPIPSVAASAWFAQDCDRPVGAFPATDERQLLRVLTAPDDPGEDAVLLRRPNGQLYAQKTLFERLGLPAPQPPLRIGVTEWHALDALAGLHYAVNRCTQTLSIDASALRPVSQHALSGTQGSVVPPGEPGAFLQTDLQGLHSDGAATWSGLLDGGVFTRNGIARANALFSEDRQIRLDTQWTRDDPASLHRLRLGDAIARGGRFGRALRYGGVQWGTEFALQPDLVTFPLPAFAGSAVLPSSIDVYVNDTLRARQDVPSGPFELNRIPVLTGGGRVQLVVTDLLGRSQVLETDFYAASELLRAGLDDYSLEAGAERRRYGLESNDYGRGFVAGTWRRGLHDALTGEIHGESDGRRHVGGAGYSLLLEPFGLISGGFALGAGDSGGGEIALAAERTMPDWSLGASQVRTDRRLLRVGEIEPASLSRSLVRASRQLGGLGSLNLAWLHDRGVDGTRLKGLSLGAQSRLWRALALSLGGFHDVEDDARDSLYLNLSWLFGAQTSAYATLQRSGDDEFARFGVQRGRRDTLGWDSGAYLDTGLSERVGGNLQYTAPRAVLRADAEDGDAGSALRLGLRSGLVMLGRDLFWTRPGEGSFAVIETDSESAVRVYDENRLVGSTRAGAPLLVGELSPYEPRQFAVADEDFGIEVALDAITQRVQMPGYGGVRVRFAGARQATQRLLLRRDGDRPPPAGSRVEAAPLPPGFSGRNGEALISGAAGVYSLRVLWDGGSCSATLQLNAAASLADAPMILPCVEPAAASEKRTP